MASNTPSPNFVGGSASSTGGPVTISGGSAQYPLDPMQGTTGGFDTIYTNVAIERISLERVDATFKEFNDPNEIRFIRESLRVVKKADTVDFLDLANFFHPLQNFSDFQKQTFNIGPTNTANIDPSSFIGTLGEVSLIIARAYYLPETPDDEKFLFWDYKGSSRYPMGQFMVLTGAIKEDLNWKGWDIDPFSTYGHTGSANISQGGLSFTNPTSRTVKLNIIIAN